MNLSATVIGTGAEPMQVPVLDPDDGGRLQEETNKPKKKRRTGPRAKAGVQARVVPAPLDKQPKWAAKWPACHLGSLCLNTFADTFRLELGHHACSCCKKPVHNLCAQATGVLEEGKFGCIDFVEKKVCTDNLTNKHGAFKITRELVKGDYEQDQWKHVKLTKETPVAADSSGSEDDLLKDSGSEVELLNDRNGAVAGTQTGPTGPQLKTTDAGITKAVLLPIEAGLTGSGDTLTYVAYNRFYIEAPGTYKDSNGKKYKPLICIACHPWTKAATPETWATKMKENKCRTIPALLSVLNVHLFTKGSSARSHAQGKAHTRLWQEAVRDGDNIDTKIKNRKTSKAGRVTSYFKKSETTVDLNQQDRFVRNLCLEICHALRPVSIVDCPYRRQTIGFLNRTVVFPSRMSMRNKHLPNLANELDTRIVKPQLDRALSVSLSFDLWMSRKCEDVFALLVHFLDPDTWEVKHYALGMVAVEHTSGAALMEVLDDLINRYNLKGKVIAYVKDEGGNLDTCTRALHELLEKQAREEAREEGVDEDAVGLVTHPALNLETPYSGHCFAHLLSGSLSKVLAKPKQGGGSKTFDHDLPKVQWFERIKSLQSCITYTKKSGKGRGLWNDAQKKFNMTPHVLITPVKTRMGSTLRMLEQLIDKSPAIDYLFNELVDAKFQKRAPTFETWIVVKSIVEILAPVNKVVKKQQTRNSSYWTLSDAVASYVKLWLEMGLTPGQPKDPRFVQLESGLQRELIFARLEAHKRIRDHLETGLMPLLKYHQKSAHVVVALLLDPRYSVLELMKKAVESKALASLHYEKELCNSEIPEESFEQAKKDAKRKATENWQMYVTQVIVPMLKSLDSKPETCAPTVNADIAALLQIYGTDTLQPTRSQDAVEELSRFLSIQTQDTDPIKFWKVNYQKFPLLGQLAKHFLGIPGTQIECERIFSLGGIMTRYLRNKTAIDLIDNVIRVNVNQPSDEKLVGQQENEINSVEDLAEALHEDADALANWSSEDFAEEELAGLKESESGRKRRRHC
jgi:hypothetical protein